MRDGSHPKALPGRHRLPPENSSLPAHILPQEGPPTECPNCGLDTPDGSAHCAVCGALLPRPAPQVIIKEARPYQLRYRSRETQREKALFLGVRIAAAVVLVIIAACLIPIEEYDCESEWVPGIGQRETCTRIIVWNVLGLVLLVAGLALLIYALARTAAG